MRGTSKKRKGIIAINIDIYIYVLEVLKENGYSGNIEDAQNKEILKQGWKGSQNISGSSFHKGKVRIYSDCNPW